MELLELLVELLESFLCFSLRHGLPSVLTDKLKPNSDICWINVLNENVLSELDSAEKS
jgi:hypothetical protein